MRTFLPFLLTIPVFAQATFPSTTLSRAITAQYAGAIPLASTAGIQPPGFPVPQGGIGDTKFPASTQWMLLIDQEAVCVNSILGQNVTGERGCKGTYTQGHANSELVWAGPAYYFHPANPLGTTCVATRQLVLPWIQLPGGNVWDCTTGSWVLRAQLHGSRMPMEQKLSLYERIRARIRVWLVERFLSR